MSTSTTDSNNQAQIRLVTLAEAVQSNDAGDITIRTEYINYLPNDIVVVKRNGLKFKIKTNPKLHHTGFIIRTEYCFKASCVLDMIQFLKRNEGKLSPILQEMVPKFMTQSSNGYVHHVTVAVDTTVSNELMTARKGSLYLIDEDTTLTTATIDKAIDHPYANGQHNNAHFEQLANLNNGLAMMLELVDNSSLVPTKIISVLNTLHEIKPIIDNGRADGAYLSVIKAGTDGTPVKVTQQYTIEEAIETLGLYNTKEEAANAGDLEGGRKLEIARLTHELVAKQEANKMRVMELEAKAKEREYVYRDKELLFKEQEIELKKQLHAIEKELISVKSKAELDKIHADITRVRETDSINSRSLHNKDYYENRSHERKDTSEMVKFIPALLGGVAVAAGWFLFA